MHSTWFLRERGERDVPVARARLDRSARRHVPETHRHVAASSAENGAIRTEADVENGLRVSGDAVGTARHRIHAIHRQRLVLNNRHSLRRLVLRMRKDDRFHHLPQRVSHRCGDFILPNVEGEGDWLFRLDQLIQQFLQLGRSGVARNIDLRTLSLSLRDKRDKPVNDISGLELHNHRGDFLFLFFLFL